jgi:hypothetical protein
MIGKGVTPRGVGVLLLIEQGLGAWVDAVRNCTCISEPECSSVVPIMRRMPGARQVAVTSITGVLEEDLLPSELYAEAARLLATLVLSARPLRQQSLESSGASI